METGIQACQDMLTALMDVGVVAMKVAKNGKNVSADVATVMGLVASAGDIMTAVKDAPMISKEIADLTDDEVKALLGTVLKMFHTIKEA